MKKTLQKTDLKLFDMNLDSTGATVDGGDVLYTGTELFVGISNRTNRAGVDFLRSAFQIPTHAIQVLDGFLHLKVSTVNISAKSVRYYSELCQNILSVLYTFTK